MAKTDKSEKDSKKDGGTGNQISLTVVVSGQPVQVTANVNAPLHTIIPESLQKSGNAGQPPENYVLKDVAGTELDLTKKIGDFNFAVGTTLFLSLKAGVTGAKSR